MHIRSALLLVGALLFVGGALADDACVFAARTPYLASDVAPCLRGAYTADSYDGDSLVAGAVAAASQYFLIGTTANEDVMTGLEALYNAYPEGGDWSPYDLEMDIARVF
ncbi:hypothetical protein KIPB_004523, partial [Kipferlia bialata]|eukprot:g4523.t1